MLGDPKNNSPYRVVETVHCACGMRFQYYRWVGKRQKVSQCCAVCAARRAQSEAREVQGHGR